MFSYSVGLLQFVLQQLVILKEKVVVLEQIVVLPNDIVVTEGAPMDLIGDRLLNISEIEEWMA